jgi:hypothetical protein
MMSEGTVSLSKLRVVRRVTARWTLWTNTISIQRPVYPSRSDWSVTRIGVRLRWRALDVVMRKLVPE